MSTLSQYLFDPLKAQLGQDVEPLFQEFVTGVESAADNLLTKSGVAGQAATPAVNLLLQIGALIGQNAIASKLGAATPAPAAQ